MKKFTVETEWSGYCRGVASYEVEAESAEEAKKLWWRGKEIYRETIRDDTETEIVGVEEE